MDPTILLNRPRTANIIPKITKISNLTIASGQARKSSTKLVKVFEKGTYLKKTQLTVLNRYKRRLDSIQKQNDKSFSKRQKVKIKLPDIKKYVGNFFTVGSTNDPFKAIGALAAFNSFQKGSKGDWGGAIKSGLVAAGLFGGIPLLKRAVKTAKGEPKPTPTPAGVGGLASKSFWGTPYAETKAGKSYAAMQAERNMPKWLQKTKGGSASRFAQSNERMFTGEANLGDIARVKTGGKFSRGNIAEFAAQRNAERGIGQFGAKAGEEAGGKLVSRALPFIGAAFSAVAAFDDFRQGNLVGGGLNVISAVADLFGQSEIALATAGLAIGSEMTYKKDDKLKTKTQQQKALIEKKKDEGGKLTFSKTLNSYNKAIEKFEEFSKGFAGSMGISGEKSGIVETGNRGLDTGQQLQDVEATGGEVPGTPDSPYGQQRPGHIHKGNDYDRPSGTAISVIQPGTVTVADMNYDPSGWGAVVEIRHPDGSLSRYAHLSKIYVAAGTQISPGQVIGLTGGIPGSAGSGDATGPHLHFEYETSAGRVDPTSVAPKIFRFGGNVRVKGSSQQPAAAPPTTPSPIFQKQQPSGLSIGQGGFRINGTPATSLAQTRQRRIPQVSQQLSYQEGYSPAEPTIVPYPVVRQQQVAASTPSEPMVFSGPSEQQLLNSFYKRVLLNTVQ